MATKTLFTQYDEQPHEIVEQERQRAEAALQKSEQLAAKLREWGVDPDRR